VRRSGVQTLRLTENLYSERPSRVTLALLIDRRSRCDFDQFGCVNVTHITFPTVS